MALGERHHRLRQARVHAGFERQRDVFERFGGWNRNTYKSNENGNAPFSFDQAKTYAKAFGVRAEWLYDGSGAMLETRGSRTVPLVGYVGAGAVAHYYASADEGLGEVDAPDNSTKDTVAVLIRGESLGPLFEEWLVFYDEIRAPVTPDLHGQLCVVGLPNDQVLVKRLMPSRSRGLYHLYSNNEAPILDQEIGWAARVKSMTPR